MSDWTDCNEKMPDLQEIEPNYWESEFVLVALKKASCGSNIDVMKWFGSPNDMTWHDGNDIWLDRDGVTHWTPLPNDPSAGEGPSVTPAEAVEASLKNRGQHLMWQPIPDTMSRIDLCDEVDRLRRENAALKRAEPKADELADYMIAQWQAFKERHK